MVNRFISFIVVGCPFADVSSQTLDHSCTGMLAGADSATERPCQIPRVASMMAELWMFIPPKRGHSDIWYHRGIIMIYSDISYL